MTRRNCGTAGGRGETRVILWEPLTRAALSAGGRAKSDFMVEEADLVKLRYFVGMTNAEAAEALGIAPRTAKYYWTHARAWLFREIGAGGGGIH